MSPRAAARLETLGFTKVYDYVNGKADWLAAGLSSQGPLAEVPTAGDAVRGGDIVCHLGERLGDSVERIRDGNVTSTLVTDPEGRLIGALYLEDAERRLAKRDGR